MSYRVLRMLGLAVGFAALVAISAPATAMFMRVDVEKVPVERLAKNLQEKIKEEPKNAQALINLARLHGMAYSLRSDQVPVNAKRPDAVWFGYEPKIVPFTAVAKTDDAEKLKAAKENLAKALELYDAALKLAPDNAAAKLGRAWLLTQTDKKDDAIAALRKLLEDAWKTEKDLRAVGLGGHTITGEGAGYLIPLLDAEKDKEEIATLKERMAQIAKLPRPITPIAIPLKDGLTAAEIEDRTAAVAFDASGSALPQKWTWIHSRNAAWLVHDPKRTGTITSGLQLFGNVSFWLFWETGYDALAALDDNRDGQLTGAELNGLALWHDANGNGVSDAGEVKPLAEYGIVALACRYERDATHPDRIATAKTGATFTDGRTRPTFDVVLHPASAK